MEQLDKLLPIHEDGCPLCKSPIVYQAFNLKNWACSNPKCKLANGQIMQLDGETDIEKAIFLLREIDAFLSFNLSPSSKDMKAMRATIQDFTSHFPYCWKCGDSGYCDLLEKVKCNC